MSSATLDVDKLFLWFMTIYGSQKMATAWGNVPAPERAAVWARALARFEPKTVYAAMHQLAESGTGWPPTLPEFVQLVRDAIPRPEHQPALPPPPRTADDIAAGAAITREIVAAASRPARDPAAWAYRILERADSRESVPAVAVTTALQAIRNLGRTPPEHWREQSERANRGRRA